LEKNKKKTTMILNWSGSVSGK